MGSQRAGLKLRSIAMLAALLLMVSGGAPAAVDAGPGDAPQPAQGLAQSASGDQKSPFTELKVPRGLRLLIFSPHPDDETLAAGGLIQRVRQSGGHVRIVFMTNGDGYLEGVRRDFHEQAPSPADFARYGNERHGEAVLALARLGLRAEDGIFLGFPDQGIDNLWESFWSRKRPYISPYTRFDRPRYKSSYEKWTGYAGADLDTEIQKTISSFSPDWIVFPDPRDSHPDHSATGLFILDAFRHLAANGALSQGRVELFSYLVHYAGYPASTVWTRTIAKARSTDAPDLSPTLSAMEWDRFDLSREELKHKTHALHAYRTQLLMMAGFFSEFASPHETFFRLQAAKAVQMPLSPPSERS